MGLATQKLAGETGEREDRQFEILTEEGISEVTSNH